MKRGSGKHMFSLFRPSRQSNISTSGEERFKYPLPWDNKISQMPYPRANKDNQIPSPCPASPPPPRRLYIDRCITSSADKAKCVKSTVVTSTKNKTANKANFVRSTVVTSTEGNSGLSTTATIGIPLGCSIPVIALVIILLILVSQVFDSINLLKTGLMMDTFKF